MKLKGFVLICVLLLSVVFLLSVISSQAISCSVVPRADCGAGKSIVIGLSKATNAHGELYNQGNYNSVLCCDFAGSHSCDGTNEILKLSDVTNAHAQKPNQEGGIIYSTPVCFEDLECDVEETSDGPCSNGGETVLSLSGETNAHIGRPGDYKQRVCCNVETEIIAFCGDGNVDVPNDDGFNEECDDGNADDGDGCSSSCGFETTAFWATPSDTTALISDIDVVLGTTEIKLVFENSGLAQGTSLDFHIQEKDLWFSDLIRTVSATIDSNGDAIASWIPAQEDIDATGEPNSFDEFFFEVEDVNSNDLTITLIEEPEPPPTTTLCSDYTNASECNGDETVHPSGYTIQGESYPDGGVLCQVEQRYECEWESSFNICNTKRSFTGNDNGECGSTPSVSCSYNESVSGDCDAGDDFVDVTKTPVANSDESCVLSSPTQRFLCSSLTQLPFFGIYGFVASAFLIAMIYAFMIFNENKKRVK